jgi:hypothetical protein
MAPLGNSAEQKTALFRQDSQDLSAFFVHHFHLEGDETQSAWRRKLSHLTLYPFQLKALLGKFYTLPILAQGCFG